jgi:hypothetical protein
MNTVTSTVQQVMGKLSGNRLNQGSLEPFQGTMEPKWMKQIPDWSICNWFYIFYVANVIVVCLVIALTLYALICAKKNFSFSNLFFALLHLIVAGTNALFFFLMCDRSLKPRM